MLAAWRPLEAIGVRTPAAWRQTEGWEGAFSIAKNAPRRRADCLGREGPLLSGVQGTGQPLQPLSPCRSPRLQHWGDSHQSQLCALVIAAVSSSLSDDHVHPGLSQSLVSPGHSRHEMGIPSAEVELKAKLSPRNCADEEELKALCVAAPAMS